MKTTVLLFLICVSFTSGYAQGTAADYERANGLRAKYEAAAKVAEWQGVESRQIADLLLRAAWCCVDEDDIEAERYFRRLAAWSFEQALGSYDGVAQEERAVLTYLVGELWRRIGDIQQARQWFDRVSDELVDPEAQHWILAAAEQQRTDPQEWFG